MGDEHDDLDVDFDFKSMLSHIDDPNAFGMDMLSPPPPQNVRANAPPLHPGTRSHQTLSMGEMLDSKLFKPDAPWSIGGSRQGLTAAPPPATFNGAVRSNRSNSGAIISTRLRAASDMHTQGFLTVEEKSLMKDLILSRNPRFKEEYANAERTNNWFNLQQFLRTYHRTSPSNSLSMAIDDLTTEFEALATPPPPLPHGHQNFGHMLAEASANAANMSKSVRKRMASQSTPVARPKKTTSSGKKTDPNSLIAIKTRAGTLDDSEKMKVEESKVPVPEAPSPTVATRSDASSPAVSAAATTTSSLPLKPISQMDDKELEIEAAIAAADGDSEAVAKIRKNERERRRRLAVSNGFDELFELLKLPQAAQIDKVSILRKAIDRIRELEARVKELEEQPVSNEKSGRRRNSTEPLA